MTSAPKLPTIVFDIGNVLVRWNPRNLYRKMFAEAEAMEIFLATACSHDWLLEADKGDVATAVMQRIAAFPHYREPLRAYDSRWLETLDGPIAENVALFEAVQARGQKVYGLTNYARDTFERSRPHLPFLDWFDGVVVSGREGVVKPDPRIYELLLGRYGLDAPDTLFIDDSAANVAAAAALGIQTIHFVPGVDLAREFARRGLLG